jgi:hypothetical protein
LFGVLEKGIAKKMNRTLRNNDKWDIRPVPNGRGINICVLEEKGFFYFGMNLIGKLVQIPINLLIKRKI